MTSEIDQMLGADAFDDYCPNGLQVQGRERVEHLVSGVSGSVELFQLAREQGADAIVVHHGIFWRGDSPRVVGPLRARLALLLEADISLLAYHLPLDAHPTLGNNAQIAARLNATEQQPFAAHRGAHIGVLAELGEDGLPMAELLAQIAAITGRGPLAFTDGAPQARRVAVVSGAGSDYLAEAHAAGADTLLTGEPTERAMQNARELGLNYIAAGHYATETFGVRALGDWVAERYAIRHTFIDVPNPI